MALHDLCVYVYVHTITVASKNAEDRKRERREKTDEAAEICAAICNEEMFANTGSTYSELPVNSVLVMQARLGDKETSENIEKALESIHAEGKKPMLEKLSVLPILPYRVGMTKFAMLVRKDEGNHGKPCDSDIGEFQKKFAEKKAVRAKMMKERSMRPTMASTSETSHDEKEV